MKKLIIAITIVLGIGMTGFAQEDAEKGLFGMGKEIYGDKGGNRDGIPGFDFDHGEEGDQDAPLGSGIVLLAGLGAAYLVGKRRNEE